MKKLAIFAIGLVIATVIFGVTVAYFYVKSREMITPHPVMGFKAEEIDEPDEYWVLSDPDKWTRKAVENPGEWVHCHKIEKQTLTHQISEHDGIYDIEYEGKYYHMRYILGDIFFFTRVTKYDEFLIYAPPIGVAVLGALWIVLVAVRVKGKNSTVMDRGRIKS